MPSINLHIHGDSNRNMESAVPMHVDGYLNAPDLFAYIEYNNPIRSGNNVSITLPSGHLWASGTDGNDTYYYYGFYLYAMLSTESGTDGVAYSNLTLTELIHKPSGDSTWFDSDYSFSNKSASVTTTGSTVYLRFFMKAGCVNCAADYHDGKKYTLVQVYSIQFSVAPVGHTITYRGINGEVVHTDTSQTSLPNSSPSASSKGIITPQNFSSFTYTFIGWQLPSGKTWGSAINSDVELKSVWSVYPYASVYAGIGNTYVSKFFGYDDTFTVKTVESISATCTYTVNDYIGGDTKPQRQTSFTPIYDHLKQTVGYPIRSGQNPNVWKPSTITYADGFTTEIAYSGSTDGGRQTYTVSGTVTTVVTITGNGADRHFANFYDTNKKYHEITNLSAWQVSITGDGEVKSRWHNPQIWKYRNGHGKNTSAENSTASGWNWWQDVELRKYDNTTQTWKITNKWKTVGTTWVNCDADLQINR